LTLIKKCNIIVTVVIYKNFGEDVYMDIYYLYLDETKANTHFPYFCLGGCIINDNIYENTIVPEINKIKRKIFGSDEVILHEIDIRKAELEPYRIMRNRQKRQEFWQRINDLFSQPNLFNTIGVAVNPSEVDSLYNNNLTNSEYFIALQIILENFTHFLEKKNGQGSIFIESRNPTEDQRMSNHFHALKANGTLFLDKNSLQRRLGTISFPVKADNNIGLQLADFIPNPIARHHAGKRQKLPNLFDHIQNKYYDGNVGMPSRFGLKKIP